ncbi:hypothetical protein [uncultured Ruminococcus sp.]|uniref:hypothetical protein n=1 Tax=uncultured Ruminococcus sp. TaxID=165186 RepID=UPI0025FF4D61|nr:hypothetical protein [uncultured Ruminococcus sp.]
MKIVLVEADEARIKQLESESAFTWEGMTLDGENIDEIAKVFVSEELVLPETDEITGYVWYGSTMNSLYGLTGENRYQDDLPFLSFDNKCFNGTGNLHVFKMEIGARWLDDIVMNNALAEQGR